MPSVSCQRRYAAASIALAMKPSALREPRPRRRAEVLGDGADHERALSLAVGREQADAGADRLRGAAKCDRLAVQLERAARQRARRRTRASATSPVPEPILPYSATTSPGANVEVDVGECALARCACEPEHRRLADRPGRRAAAAGRRRSRGRPSQNQLARGQRPATVADEDDVAVAEHLNAVGDLAHLVEPVGDVDHRDAALAQAVHEREEALDLLGRERRRRLVEDQAARLSESARAISTTWRSPMRSEPTGRIEVDARRRAAPAPLARGGAAHAS